MSRDIAVIDDEEDIVELVSLHLNKGGYKTKGYYDAGSFIKSLEKSIPELIVLDLMLPDMDGVEVCKYLRSHEKYKAVLIIMLTAKEDEIDKIIGLEVGADDYVTKPFSPRELVARVKAIFRRRDELTSTPAQEQTQIELADYLTIDRQKYEVYDKDKRKIKLTTTEFKILTILAENRGWVYSREKLLNKIWGEDKYVIDRTVDVHIRNLREKLGEAGKLIVNVRGVGYKLDL